MTSRFLMAHDKNYVIASEVNHENDTYSTLKLKNLSAITFIRSKSKTKKQKRADKEYECI